MPKTINPLGESDWAVYIINNNLIALDHLMIVSKGYGKIDGTDKKTSILRHMIEKLEATSFAKVEPIDPAVFSMYDKFWVSYLTVFIK